MGKCRFIGKEVREISCFFVAPLRVFAPAVCALTHLIITQKYPHLSTQIGTQAMRRFSSSSEEHPDNSGWTRNEWGLQFSPRGERRSDRMVKTYRIYLAAE